MTRASAIRTDFSLYPLPVRPWIRQSLVCFVLCFVLVQQLTAMVPSMCKSCCSSVDQCVSRSRLQFQQCQTHPAASPGYPSRSEHSWLVHEWYSRQTRITASVHRPTCLGAGSTDGIRSSYPASRPTSRAALTATSTRTSPCLFASCPNTSTCSRHPILSYPHS